MPKSSDSNKKQQANEAKRAKKKLMIAGVSFAVAAVIIAVFQILPAQFGIDLTGYGEYVGLTSIYEAKQQLAQMRNTTERQETAQIEIAPGEELEYKVYLLEGDPLEYSWKTDNGEIYSEFHGEPLGGYNAVFQTHKTSTGSEDSGTFSAPFEGTHGWYWRNDNEQAVTVSLEVQGKFNIIGKKAASFSR